VTERKNAHGEQPPAATTTPAPVARAAETVQATAQHAAEVVQARVEQAAETAQRVTEASQTRARAATVPVRLARRRSRVFLWIALGALAAFAGLAVVVHGHHQNSVDLRITQAVQREQRRHAWLGRAMTLVSTPGFAPWSWLLPVLTAGTLRWLGYRLESLFMLGTGGAGAIVVVIKLIMARPRPSHESIIVTTRLKDYSFPSGHTIQYAAQFGYGAYLAFALLRPGRLRRVVLAACGALIVLIGPSRIAMGHHWASDVLASFCLGTAFLIAHIGLYRRLKARQRPVAPRTSMTVPAEDSRQSPVASRQ
jgi:undecaprenyl-diphosphatase